MTNLDQNLSKAEVLVTEKCVQYSLAQIVWCAIHSQYES